MTTQHKTPIVDISQTPRLLTINETARYLKVCRAKLYRDVIQDLESVRIGGRHLILRESVDRFIDRLRSTPEAA